MPFYSTGNLLKHIGKIRSLSPHIRIGLELSIGLIGLLALIVHGSLDQHITLSNTETSAERPVVISKHKTHKKDSTSSTPKTTQPTSSSSSSTTSKTTGTTVTPTTHNNPAPKVSAPVVPSPSSNVSGLTPAPASVTPPQSGGSSGGSNQSTTPPNYYSTNWSGYMANSGSFSSISASWVVPVATGNSTSTTADATWIGIGGVTTGDLIQTGTVNIVSASGQVTTTAFYEMLPDASVTIPGLTINDGDSITASLEQVSADLWSISFEDNTSGQTYSTDLHYDSSESSAEWIEEDPSYRPGSLIPLDYFTSAAFSDCATTNNGNSVDLDSASSSSITMQNQSGQTVATPSGIGSDGASFNVTRDTP